MAERSLLLIPNHDRVSHCSKLTANSFVTHGMVKTAKEIFITLSFLQSGSDPIVLSCQPLKLFKEYEGKNSMRSKTKVIRRKAFPQGENSFLSYHFQEHILEKE